MKVSVATVGETSLPVSSLSFEVLYRENAPAIWRFLERLGVPSRHLEDAAQDTFIVAHKRLPTFRGASSVTTWLHGIALKVAKDYRRSEARRGRWEPLAHELTAVQLGPDQSAANREELDLVLKLLDALEERQRTVFVLMELQGLTTAEAAEVTEANMNTVSTRLRAARQRFSELVQAHGGAR